MWFLTSVAFPLFPLYSFLFVPEILRVLTSMPSRLRLDSAHLDSSVNLCQVVFSDNVELMNWVSIGMIAFYSVITVIARPFSEHFSLVCHNADF